MQWNKIKKMIGVTEKGTRQLIGGLLIGFFSVFLIIMGSPMGILLILLSIFGVVSGAYRIEKEWKKFERQERYKNYINHVVMKNITSMEKIAAIENIPYEVVKEELQTLIDKGYFQGKLDLEKKQIRLDKNPESGKVIHCPNCGASNIIQEYGRTECGYCEYKFEK